MIRLGRLAAKHRIGKGMPLANRHRRQVHPVRHIPHRIDRRNRGLAPVVHHDLPARAQFDP